MRTKFIMGSMLALSLTATATMAGTHVGWYVAADAGLHQTPTQKVTITDSTVFSRDVDSFEFSSSSSTSSTSGSASAPALSAITANVPSGPAVDVIGSEFGLKTKPGAALFARAGYQFTPHWRVEGEIGDRLGKIKDLGEGHSNISTQMINVLYDFAPEKDIHPFVGLGAGQATTKTTLRGNIQSVTINGIDQDIVYKVNSKTTNGAWQALAGLTWSLSDHLNLDVTYRWLDAGKVRYSVTADSTYDVDVIDDECNQEEACLPNAGKVATNARAVSPRVNAAVVGTTSVMETDILTSDSRRVQDHSVTVGLRWSFGGSTPPPPPVVAEPMSPPIPEAPPVTAPIVESYGPQVTAPRAFTVYFNFDKSNLTDEARQVVNAAASYALSAPSPSLTVTGHTDTSGSQAYNVRLSEKRANAVAQGLTEAGVSAEAIKLGWTGEDDLAVPTGNGVKNPENRRTTIDVTF